MAARESLEMLGRGVVAWNGWRKLNSGQRPDLSGHHFGKANLDTIDLSAANLAGANFEEVSLRSANLDDADLTNAVLWLADLGHATLRRADLTGAKLQMSMLSTADMTESRLCRADLTQANLNLTKLHRANLAEARLIGASLIQTDLTYADLTDCQVYGISAWEVMLDGAVQRNLSISRLDEHVITVDNLQVAQFIYLLIANQNIRQIIDTITSKVVLILGRFSPKRKTVLDALRTELRRHDLLPILFDFEGPKSRDIHETVGTLARMSLFIIADITQPKSVPQELVSIVEQLPSVPVQPIIASGEEPWGMYDHIRRYPWVLELVEYRSVDELRDLAPSRLVDSPRAVAEQLRRR